jgi:ribosomal protein S27AE
MADCHRPLVTSTLADLGQRVSLHARCARCGRVRRLDVAALRARYGALPLERLRRRLRCGRCGAREPELTQLWDVGGP